METGHRKTVRVAFPIVKMSQKMLQGKRAAGHMTNKELCMSGNILEYYCLFLYLWDVPECNQMCTSKKTNPQIWHKNSNYNESTSASSPPYFC